MNFVPPSDIHIGPVPIHLYGLMLALAVIASWLMAVRLAKRFGIKSEQVDRALIWLAVSGFLGARIYFVLFEFEYFSAHPSEIIAFWHGGISIYGAVIGAVLGAYWFAQRNNIRFWRLLDLVAVVAPLGQAIGRWGNFFNQEAFGRPTDLPWKIYVEPQFRPHEYLDFRFFHPTFLYESLWNFAVFLVMIKLASSNRRQDGLLAGTYLMLYPLGRFFIESLRLDSVFLFHSIRADQVTSLAMFCLGLWIYWFAGRKKLAGEIKQ